MGQRTHGSDDVPVGYSRSTEYPSSCSSTLNHIVVTSNRSDNDQINDWSDCSIKPVGTPQILGSTFLKVFFLFLL